MRGQGWATIPADGLNDEVDCQVDLLRETPMRIKHPASLRWLTPLLKS
jgi:hypothetical protein